MSAKKKFVPMKVKLNVEQLHLDKKNAEAKLKYLDEGVKWCEKHIDVSKLDKKQFLFDMEKAFEEQVIQQHGDIVKKEIAVDKLYFLLDISIVGLRDIQNKADSLRIKVGIKDNEYFTKVVEEDYWLMTSNEEENEKLIRANNLIQALEMVGKYRNVFPTDVCRATSNFLNYDYRRNHYFMNIEELSK